MLSILAITVPIYLLVGVGFLAVRLGVFGGGEMRVLGKFTLNVALPALLFDALAQRRIAEVVNGSFLAAYAGGSLTVLLGAFALARFGRRKSAPESALIGIGSAFPNSALIGYPIVAQWLGPPAAVALALCMMVENTLLLPLTLALAESDASASWHSALRQSMGRLVRNPLVIAIVAGLVVALTGVPVPAPVSRPIGMLAMASAPVALFVIGGSLVGLAIGPLLREVAPIAAGKLVVHPLVVLLFVLLLPPIEPALRAAVVAYASMPMLSIYPILAQKYGREGICAAALLLTTLLSFATISVVLWVLSAGLGWAR
jgi:malonate transporter and related proteins